MRVLVAGGAGFLGTHLVDHLLRQGDEVIIADCFVTGSQETIDPLRGSTQVTILNWDITEPYPDDLEVVVDQIYNLACPASPLAYQKDPIKTLQTCYVGTENLLKLAVRCKARFLLSSTSEIYGNPLVSPQKETYYGNVNPYGPRSCYDEGKRVAESLCYAYQQMHNVDIRIARVFNAYGPGMKPSDGRVVSSFIAAALQSQSLHIRGDGTSVRCFQYVSDCIEGLTRLMASKYTKPINIGSDIPCQIDDLATIVLKLARLVVHNGFPLKIPQTPVVYEEALVDDPVLRQPDISLAKKVLQWEPVIELEVGLQMTMQWMANDATMYWL